MRVLFIRFGSIGNALVSVPAIRAIRKAHPSAFLALLCDPATYDLWKNCPWLDKVIIYDQKKTHKAGIGYLKLIAQLRKLNFTHSVHFRRFLRSELLGFLSGAKTRVGFDPGGFSLLTKKIPYSEEEPIIIQNLKLAKELGASELNPELEYWAGEPSERVSQLLEGAGLKVVLSPFGRTGRKRRWKGYPLLAEFLSRELGAKVIITGTSDEQEIFRREWGERSRLVTTGFELSLCELASLLKNADLFVGQDTGPAHLSVAVGTKTIIIYSPSPDWQRNYKKWRPLNQNLYPILPERDCKSCPVYPCNDDVFNACLAEQIPLEKVESACLNLLEKR